MSRTQGRNDGDTGYADAQFFFAPSDFLFVGTAGTVTRNAQGNIVSLLAASTAYVIEVPLSGIMFRSGAQDDVQEVFGGGAGLKGTAGNALFGSNLVASPGFRTWSTGTISAGQNVAIAVLTGTGSAFTKGQVIQLDTVASGVQENVTVTVVGASSITVNAVANAHATNCVIASAPFTTPGSVSGRPPYTGITNLTPVTAPRPKGLQINQLDFIYSVVNGGNALTTNTAGLTITSYNNLALPTITTLITTAANSLQTAAVGTAGFFYVSPVLNPTPAYLVAPDEDAIIEWNITTPAGSTCQVAGVNVRCTYNYC